MTSILRSSLLTEPEKHCYLAGQRYYNAVSQHVTNGCRDAFWIEEKKISRRLWLDTCRSLMEAEKDLEASRAAAKSLGAAVK